MFNVICVRLNIKNDVIILTISNCWVTYGVVQKLEKLWKWDMKSWRFMTFINISLQMIYLSFVTYFAKLKQECSGFPACCYDGDGNLFLIIWNAKVLCWTEHSCLNRILGYVILSNWFWMLYGESLLKTRIEIK